MVAFINYWNLIKLVRAVFGEIATSIIVTYLKL
jgi:hypothetical protein